MEIKVLGSGCSKCHSTIGMMASLGRIRMAKRGCDVPVVPPQPLARQGRRLLAPGQLRVLATVSFRLPGDSSTNSRRTEWECCFAGRMFANKHRSANSRSALSFQVRALG